MTSLRQRFIEDMQIRNLSVHTQRCYVLHVSLFARHFHKSPELLGPEHIRAYQVYLTNEKKLATGSIALAIAALRFLYRVTLKKNWSFADVLPAPKVPQTLPIVLSPEEVIQFLKSRGPGRWPGQSGKELGLTVRFLHSLVEQHATEVSRLNSGVLYNTDQEPGSKFRAQSSG